MRLRILSTSFLFGLCGCFVPISRENDAAAVLEGAVQSHNESEKGRLSIHNSDKEARAFDIDGWLEKVSHFIAHHVRKTLENMHNAHPTNEESKEMLEMKSALEKHLNELLQTKIRSKEDNQSLLFLIQQLQDCDDLHLQLAGAVGLVDMLRSGTKRKGNNARLDIGKILGKQSKNKWFDQELVRPWFAYVAQWVFTNELTVKQVQFYEALMTQLSENEMIDLASALLEVTEGGKAINRLLVLMVADPMTRERAFRLQLECGGSHRQFLTTLLHNQSQDPASLPLNVWLEYVAYYRFSTSGFYRAEIRSFANSIFEDLDTIASRSKQKEMFSAIVNMKKFELNIKVGKTPQIKVFKWIPDDRNEWKQFEYYLMDHEWRTMFMDALNNKAVINAFRAAEALDKDQVLSEVLSDRKVSSLLPFIIKDKYYFGVYKTALRDKQVKKLAKELLDFVDNLSLA